MSKKTLDWMKNELAEKCINNDVMSDAAYDWAISESKYIHEIIEEYINDCIHDCKTKKDLDILVAGFMGYAKPKPV